MWENEHKKAVIQNTLLFIILFIAIAAFVVAMKTVGKQIAEEDQALSAASSSQRQELSQARQENIDLILQAYEEDMQTVADYMPGIICWGDSLTAGSSGNISYPYTLQNYIDANICDVYDFSSTIENAASYSQIKWSDYQVSIPVVNMGAGQENTATILGRAGVAPYVTTDDFVIPAGTESVKVGFTAPDGTAVTPLTAGAAGINPVTIAGIEGTLSLDDNYGGWNRFQYSFTRLEAGEETVVPKGTEILSSSVDAYKDYVHVVWLGTYNPYRGADQLISDVKLLLSNQTSNPDRYLVIGPCTVGGNWNTSSATLDPVDSAMLQTFGDHYINLRKYLVEDGLRDAGIGASREDTTQMKRGLVPASFRSNASAADLNAVAYQLVGRLVYYRMDQLGYFTEIRQELGIDNAKPFS